LYQDQAALTAKDWNRSEYGIAGCQEESSSFKSQSINEVWRNKHDGRSFDRDACAPEPLNQFLGTHQRLRSSLLMPRWSEPLEKIKNSPKTRPVFSDPK
jgi:hypothetical protein